MYRIQVFPDYPLDNGSYLCLDLKSIPFGLHIETPEFPPFAVLSKIDIASFKALP
jgi:hypothetical protein